MAEALAEFLGIPADPEILAYLEYLGGKTVEELQTTEMQKLAQEKSSLQHAIQALARRSCKSMVESAASHATLRKSLPLIAQRSSELTQSVIDLGAEADRFCAAFSKTGSSNSIIAQRKEALLLQKNADRLLSVMELPTLLSSAINSQPPNYGTALDLYAHVCRLATLYPTSALIASIAAESESIIRQMAADLVAALQAPPLKLATGLRNVGWLKRLVPDLVPGADPDHLMPGLFLICRLKTLLATLAALAPLRELADKERLRADQSSGAQSGGQQTERYLKRYIEIFREHSFSIVSMAKSIDASFSPPEKKVDDPLGPLPSALSTFPMHLVGLLLETLQTYLPTVKDPLSRDSIITQVLYCAGSLGRLGADFGVLLADIGIDEWADLVRRHRSLAGRLESVIGDYRAQQPATNITTARASQAS